MSFCASLQVFCLSFLLFGSKYGGIPKISFLGTPKAGEKQCMDKRERKKERKYVITMASYACKRHHRWCTQTTNYLDENKTNCGWHVLYWTPKFLCVSSGFLSAQREQWLVAQRWGQLGAILCYVMCELNFMSQKTENKKIPLMRSQPQLS